MKTNRNVLIRWILCILYGILGMALLACNLLNVIEEYWGGMGAAFLFIAVLQAIRLIRYRTSAKYKEETDTAVNDERNRFISSKAWAWAGYLYIMISAIATIVLKLLGQETLMFFCSGSVCVILVLYWVSYFILRKKY